MDLDSGTLVQFAQASGLQQMTIPLRLRSRWITTSSTAIRQFLTTLAILVNLGLLKMLCLLIPAPVLSPFK